MLPGVVDAHTHTRIPSEALPDRFYDDSVGAACGGTTTFLAFNNPGTGISEAAQHTLRAGIAEWRAATAGESAVDFGLSGVITAQQERPEDDIAAAIEAGVATFKVFFVYDFGVDARRLGELLVVTHRAGGLLEVHGEDRAMLDAGIARELAGGRSQPRFHAASRPPEVEAAGTRAAIDVARDVGAPVYFVHVTSAAAVGEISRARGSGQLVFAETCPQYLVLDESVYDSPDEVCTRFVISPPLRSTADQTALWSALSNGTLDLIATDSVPDHLAHEKRWLGQPFDRISNGAPGIETLLPIVWGKGVATGRLTMEQAVDLLATTPARLFGLRGKGSLETGKDADIVLLDPNERWTIRASDQHHSSDFTLFEGLEVQGRIRRVILRGEDVVRDGRFVGRRGEGRFQERFLG
ncbi:MAG TPA: amidohydrolase family protein [Candidatus Limnocylindrales bacterium]|nr:amidohydrolase family protein [Candidatus Limnocylindrales bacterium]